MASCYPEKKLSELPGMLIFREFYCIVSPYSVPEGFVWTIQTEKGIF
jgi:hypothetical protein